MEEADHILLLSLRQAGCPIPDSATSVVDLSAGQVVGVCQHCLQVTNGQKSLEAWPTGLPKETSARFRLCADLAAAIQQLGYRGELNFHQFLYPNESDSRQLLRFLVDKLSHRASKATKSRPRRGLQPAAETSILGNLGTRETVQRALAGWVQEAEVARRKKAASAWGIARASLIRSKAEHIEAEGGITVPERPVTVPFRTRPLQLGHDRSVGDGLPLLPKGEDLTATILELNAKRAVREAQKRLSKPGADGSHKLSGVFDDVASLLQEKKGASVSRRNLGKAESAGGGPEDEAAEQGTREAELAALQERIAIAAEAAAKALAKAQATEAEVAALVQEGSALDKERTRLEEDYLILKKTTKFVLGREGGLGELKLELRQRVIEGDTHMQALQSEWEAVAAPLLEQREQLAAEGNNLRGAATARLQQIQEVQKQQEEAAQKSQEKEEEQAQLLVELERAPQDLNRMVYVRRILDITKQIRKQDGDIAKIISDTKELQRESNATQDKLSRIHTLVDELIFRDAKKDPVCKTAYKLLSSIHQRFADLIEQVTETDRMGRAIQDLESKLEAIEKRPLDLPRVQADLEAIQKENQQLEAALRTRRTPQS